MMPFGAERYASDVGRAAVEAPTLFPSALDLDSLDTQQSSGLRTWFVARMPLKIRRRSQVSFGIEQLSLL
ncbi:hypothetical protein [Leptothoe spongobia]|uniref:Uncharacterized protein n=1 Tax=Leptothoe spongobia TAU-MAC 1115 TaxID=1967444 RepID=A0A947DEW5_9CYAN|nr:hypothetical protein [Leptothoe spongobia]MBT9315601.1 hypothetical protein [Leptothoe spongobia TAU-MAC 1115]